MAPMSDLFAIRLLIYLLNAPKLLDSTMRSSTSLSRWRTSFLHSNTYDVCTYYDQYYKETTLLYSIKVVFSFLVFLVLRVDRIRQLSAFHSSLFSDFLRMLFIVSPVQVVMLSVHEVYNILFQAGVFPTICPK